MMARLEGEVFPALAQKVQDIELTGSPQLRLQPGLRGLSSLPLRLTRKSDSRVRSWETSSLQGERHRTRGGAGFRARGDNVLLVDHRPQAADLVAEQAPGAFPDATWQSLMRRQISCKRRSPPTARSIPC